MLMLSEEFITCYTKSTTLVVSTEVLSLLPKRSSLAITRPLAKQRVTGGRDNDDGRSDGEERVKLQCCHIKQALPTITGLRLCRVRSSDNVDTHWALLAPTGETAHYQSML